MDTILLVVKLKKAKAGLVAGKRYYYPVAPFESVNGQVVLMTDDRARAIFLSDPDGYKRLLATLPAACSNWIDFGDLIVPPPASLPTSASVLRVAHILLPNSVFDGDFTILAELQNSTPADKAYVQIIGKNGTGWSQTGKYPMAVQAQNWPPGQNTLYSFEKTFSGLKKGDTIEYRVYANEQIVFLSGTISVENASTVNGPVWGSWKPKKVTPGMGYFDNLPADAATGTGPIYYRLESGPAWYGFAKNTRNILANPTPGTAPTTPVSVVFEAQDANGFTEKTFPLEFAGQLPMHVGVGFYEGGPSLLYIGIGPDDAPGYLTRLTALSPGTVWTATSAMTAERSAVGIATINYPYRDIRQNVPIGIFLLEVTRVATGEKGYALIEQTGNNYQKTALLSETKPVYTPPTGFVPVAVGEIWELVADAVTVVDRYILLPNPIIEGNPNETAVLMEKLSSGPDRPYAGSFPLVWQKALPAGGPVTIDGATGVIHVPMGSLTADATLRISVTYAASSQLTAETTLKNVDPAVTKPVRQTDMNDIYHNQPGAKTINCPAPWFLGSPGTLTAHTWNGTTKSPLPMGVSFVASSNPPRFDLAPNAPNVKLPVLITCENAAGADTDLIQLWIDRSAAVGKITGIWRGFSGNSLQYWVHGTLLGNDETWRVEYRQTPAGIYNGTPSTDWSPFRLVCTPGTDTGGLPDFNRSYGLSGRGTQTHVEFRVVDTATGAVVGPTVALDFTIPFPDEVYSPQLVYSA